MKMRFVEKSLRVDTLQVIEQANKIIESFQAQGYRMTLRQLYYQFVTRNLIRNEEKSYKRLASIVSDGRLAGLIDWDAIEDRGRTPSVPSHYNGLRHIMQVINNAAEGYTLDKWEGQDTYVELWVEKQALAGVLEPLAEKYHVTLMVNKGYSSQSAMYESANRFIGNMEKMRDGLVHREGLLLYLGDHDPSGEDMVRDIAERMRLFGVGPLFSVEKVALTTAQVRQYNPPPNPAKVSDPRAGGYIAQHGRSSWEVDALDPPVLVQLISAAIERVIDVDALKALNSREARERGRLKTALAAIDIE